jgi:uncharacterized protein (TIGR03118 family)
MRRTFSLAFGLSVLAAFVWAQQAPAAATTFKVVPLVSNQTGKAPNVDPHLVNPWGLSQAPGNNPIWVSDNGTGLSTLYAPGTGQIQSLVVTIPKGSPTGTVFAPSIGFPVSENGKTGDSVFIFDSLSGVLTGWSFNVDTANAIIAVDNSAKGASYTGLAIDPSTKLLFAANFGKGKVEVYDSTWKHVRSFTNASHTGFAPYNVAVINGSLYVTFARTGPLHSQGIPSAGSGYVDVFSETGTLKKPLIAGGVLDSPWGISIAPSTFGKFANALLVGNLGNGRIYAFNASTGALMGTLRNTLRKPIVLSGLWSLDPVPNGKITFSAGPNGFADGLIGMIQVAK